MSPSPSPEQDLGKNLEALFARDQAGLEGYIYSLECYDTLHSMMDRYEGTHFEGQAHYLLSFLSFHEARRFLFYEQNPDRAKVWLEKSLKHAADSTQCPEYAYGFGIGFEGNMRWKPYVQGTLAYMNSDQVLLQECIHAGPIGTDILEKLADGLQNFGTPDYIRDLSK